VPRAITLVPSSSVRRRVLLVALLAGAVGLAYFGWFRDSSLVAVREVEVQGASGADREQIVAELTDAAKEMTTLHVKTDELASAVREFPSVASVSADAGFPHALEITVVEHQPTLIAHGGDRQVPVAADGSLLPGVKAGDEKLPSLPVDELPSAGRLSGDALSEALAIGGAAPPDRRRLHLEGLWGGGRDARGNRAPLRQPRPTPREVGCGRRDPRRRAA
jgi:cell division protein FtsQ